MKSIIVNADDLGLTNSVTDGILEGLASGAISDASLMANGEAFDKAVAGLKAHGIEATGIHCCLVDGETPLENKEQIGVLLDGGTFPKAAVPFGLLLRILLHPFLVKRAVRAEISAQIEQIQKVGLRISHLDSHQHIHLFPVVSSVVIDLCLEYRIPVIRIPITAGQGPVSQVFRFLSKWTEKKARKKGVRTVRARGYDNDGPINQATFDAFVAASAVEPFSEIIVHPGHGDAYSHEKYDYWRTRHWDEELAALKDMNENCMAQEVAKISFDKAVKAWPSIPCPGCSSKKWSMKYQLAFYSIVKCGGCGLLYNRDFLSQGAVTEIFSEDYYKETQSEGFEHVFNENYDDPSAAMFLKGLSDVEDRIGVGRVLDVGCAFGLFLTLARSRGWQVSGVEVSPYSSAYAREKNAINVSTGTLMEASPPEKEYDLITFWDVLEHVTEVDQNVARAAELLKPGGILLLTTDNPASLIGILGSLIFKTSFGRIQYPLRRFLIPKNSCYPTPQCMKKILNRNGLEVISEAGIDHPVERINLNPLEMIILKVIYKLGDLFGANSQFIMLAKKT